MAASSAAASSPCRLFSPLATTSSRALLSSIPPTAATSRRRLLLSSTTTTICAAAMAASSKAASASWKVLDSHLHVWASPLQAAEKYPYFPGQETTLRGDADFLLEIIIPVRRPRSWCAYAWDMKMQNTSILDPMAAMATEEATLETHRTTIRRLHAALANCIELFFDGWTPDWQKWEITVVKSDNLTATTEQSALYTLFNIINFNGRKLVVEPTTEATKAFRENFLYEMMSIEDNKGKVSSIFVHTIED